MRTLRYPQFCALARAAEVIGERWTLLIVRELFLGPKRFTDLRGRLDGISPSVLTERLARAEALGLVERTALPAPAVGTMYRLSDDGRALEPAIFELIRWGARYLCRSRRGGDRFEGDWTKLALAAYARRGPSPRRSIELRIRDGGKTAVVRIAGGPNGAVVSDTAAPCHATVVTSMRTLMSLIAGALSVKTALASKRIAVKGDDRAVADLPRLFDAATLAQGGTSR